MYKSDSQYSYQAALVGNHYLWSVREAKEHRLEFKTGKVQETEKGGRHAVEKQNSFFVFFTYSFSYYQKKQLPVRARFVSCHILLSL